MEDFMNQLYFMGIFKNQQDFYNYLFKSSNEKDNKKKEKMMKINKNKRLEGLALSSLLY